MASTGARIAAGSTVEEAMRLLAAAPDGDAVVTSAAGEALGLVNLRELAGAMVNSHTSAPHATAAQ
jgi:glycine betaine/proline transport system ATP-binding protein